jgi:membrane protein required for beta-lactamase induction
MELFWLLLEAGVALALLLLIVWWTWPRRSHDPQHEKPPEEK